MLIIAVTLPQMENVLDVYHFIDLHLQEFSQTCLVWDLH